MTIDLTLDTLLAVRKEIAPDLDETLLTRCYSIQKQFQFLDDRTVSVSEMDKLIDENVTHRLEQTRS